MTFSNIPNEVFEIILLNVNIMDLIYLMKINILSSEKNIIRILKYKDTTQLKAYWRIKEIRECFIDKQLVFRILGVKEYEKYPVPIYINDYTMNMVENLIKKNMLSLKNEKKEDIPLFNLVLSGGKTMIKRIISIDKNLIKLTNYNGDNVLIYLLKNDKLRLFSYILNLKIIDLCHANIEDKTILWYALTSFHPENLLKFLIKFAKFTKLDDLRFNNDYLSDLILSRINKCSLNMLFNFIGCGQFINNDDCLVELFKNASDDHEDNMIILMNYLNFEQLNVKGKNGDTLIMMACKNKNLKIFQILLEKGLNSNVKNNEGKHCLHYLVEKYYFLKDSLKVDTLTILNTLLKYGSDINVVDKYNNGPLSIMVRNGRLSHRERGETIILDKIIKISNHFEYYGDEKLDLLSYLLSFGLETYEDLLLNEYLTNVNHLKKNIFNFILKVSNESFTKIIKIKNIGFVKNEYKQDILNYLLENDKRCQIKLFMDSNVKYNKNLMDIYGRKHFNFETMNCFTVANVDEDNNDEKIEKESEKESYEESDEENDEENDEYLKMEYLCKITNVKLNSRGSALEDDVSDYNMNEMDRHFLAGE